MLISQCHFDGLPLKLMGLLLGPLEPTAFLKPMGPRKSMGPGVIVPPAPPFIIPAKSEAKAKDSHFEVRPSRGQGQKCSRHLGHKRKSSQKKVFKRIFQAISKKIGLQNNFQAISKKTVGKKFFNRPTKF